VKEPLDNVRARQSIRKVVATGDYGFSRHALERMQERNMDALDVRNVLRGGKVDKCEQECGTWRYHVSTPNMTVVVAFRSETELRVVTAWRNK
jgi:hypothetical protein